MTTRSDYLASTRAIDDLRALNARFIHNFVTNDVASHDSMLHERFIGVQSDGSRIGRAAYLKRWATGFDPTVIVYWDVRDELITVIDATALVRATNKSVVRRDGREVAGMAAYTDVYLYEGDAWKCVQAQITPVASAVEPPDETILSVYLNGVLQPRPR